MKQSELVTVGWAYGQAEAGLAMALLDAAGIEAFPHSWYTASVQWSLTHALGGIALLVPAGQAGEASDLLAAHPIARRPRSLLQRVLTAAVAIAVLAWAGIPPPGTGLCAAALRPARAQVAATSGQQD